MGKIYYKKGYKYQLDKDYLTFVEIFPEVTIVTKYIVLRKDGHLTIKEGYAWDGPSGPTIDTKNFMRGSLIHDALYQLMREEFLPQTCRKQADQEMYNACKEDGMSSIRRWLDLKGVRKFSGFAANPKNKKELLTAP